ADARQLAAAPAGGAGRPLFLPASLVAELEAQAAAVRLQPGILERTDELARVALQQLHRLGLVDAHDRVDPAVVRDLHLHVDAAERGGGQLDLAAIDAIRGRGGDRYGHLVERHGGGQRARGRVRSLGLRLDARALQRLLREQLGIAGGLVHTGGIRFGLLRQGDLSGAGLRLRLQQAGSFARRDRLRRRPRQSLGIVERHHLRFGRIGGRCCRWLRQLRSARRRLVGRDRLFLSEAEQREGLSETLLFDHTGRRVHAVGPVVLRRTTARSLFAARLAKLVLETASFLAWRRLSPGRRLRLGRRGALGRLDRQFEGKAHGG